MSTEQITKKASKTVSGRHSPAAFERRGDVMAFNGDGTSVALDRLRSLVVDGLKHGFFDYSISCQIVNGSKRQLVIRAGKSHMFTIPEDDLPR